MQWFLVPLKSQVRLRREDQPAPKPTSTNASTPKTHLLPSYLLNAEDETMPTGR